MFFSKLLDSCDWGTSSNHNKNHKSCSSATSALSGKYLWALAMHNAGPGDSLVGFPVGSAGKVSACNTGDLGSIPGLGRYLREGNGYPLQYSGLENSMAYSKGSQRVRHDWETFTVFCPVQNNSAILSERLLAFLAYSITIGRLTPHKTRVTAHFTYLWLKGNTAAGGIVG